MPFQKGHAYCKRKKETNPFNISIAQKLVYKHIEKFLKNNINNIQQHFDALESSRDKLYFIESLFNYSVPRQKQVDVTTGGETLNTEPIQVIVKTDTLNKAIEKLTT